MSYARPNISRISGYTPGEQPQDRVYTKLNTNENPYPPSPKIAEALANFDVSLLRRYSEPLSLELRELAGAPFGLGRDWVLAGNGSDDLLTIALRTFVDQGGVLAYPDPSYSLYPVLGDLQGVRHQIVSLDENFCLPENTVELAGDASLLFICRPNAPTGNACPKVLLRHICREFDGVVWIDEAYADFAESSCIEFVRDFDNVVVSRSLSKSYSLAGLRLGFAFAQPTLITEMLKVKDSYNVDMLTQVVGAAALKDRDYMLANTAKVRTTRAYTANELAKLGFRVLPSEANFLLAAPPVDAEQLFLALRGEGFIVRYFSQERIKEYIRISIGTDEEMEAFLKATETLLKKL